MIFIFILIIFTSYYSFHSCCVYVNCSSILIFHRLRFPTHLVRCMFVNELGAYSVTANINVERDSRMLPLLVLFLFQREIFPFHLSPLPCIQSVYAPWSLTPMQCLRPLGSSPLPLVPASACYQLPLWDLPTLTPPSPSYLPAHCKGNKKSELQGK